MYYTRLVSLKNENLVAKNKNICHYVQDHILRILQCLFPVSMSLEGENYGALRVWMDDVGSYSLVCADGFTDVEATTACMDMGYVYGKSICCSAFGDVENKVPHILNYQFYHLYFIKLSMITLFILHVSFSALNIERELMLMVT